VPRIVPHGWYCLVPRRSRPYPRDRLGDEGDLRRPCSVTLSRRSIGIRPAGVSSSPRRRPDADGGERPALDPPASEAMVTVMSPRRYSGRSRRRASNWSRSRKPTSCGHRQHGSAGPGALENLAPSSAPPLFGRPARGAHVGSPSGNGIRAMSAWRAPRSVEFLHAQEPPRTRYH
jgi:hypothetical protein